MFIYIYLFIYLFIYLSIYMFCRFYMLYRVSRVYHGISHVYLGCNVVIAYFVAGIIRSQSVWALEIIQYLDAHPPNRIRGDHTNRVMPSESVMGYIILSHIPSYGVNQSESVMIYPSYTPVIYNTVYLYHIPQLYGGFPKWYPKSSKSPDPIFSNKVVPPSYKLVYKPHEYYIDPS